MMEAAEFGGFEDGVGDGDGGGGGVWRIWRRSWWRRWWRPRSLGDLTTEMMEAAVFGGFGDGVGDGDGGGGGVWRIWRRSWWRRWWNQRSLEDLTTELVTETVEEAEWHSSIMFTRSSSVVTEMRELNSGTSSRVPWRGPRVRCRLPPRWRACHRRRSKRGFGGGSVWFARRSCTSDVASATPAQRARLMRG